MSAAKGVYLLIFTLSADLELEIGKLGRYVFLSGNYVYVGSGMGGVIARVKRHLSTSKTKRWHIDYLLTAAEAKKAIIYLTEDKSQECRLSALVQQLPQVETPVTGFGSSDCHCKTHLYRLSPVSYEQITKLTLSGCVKSPLLTVEDLPAYCATLANCRGNH